MIPPGMIYDELRDKLLPASAVSYDLKSPCDDCPFRKSSPYHSGVAGGVWDTIRTIEINRFSHTCHKTDYRQGCDGPRAGGDPGQIQACIGSLLMLLKTGDGVDLQLPLLQAAERGQLDLDDLAARARVDEATYTFPEFLAQYAQWEYARTHRDDGDGAQDDPDNTFGMLALRIHNELVREPGRDITHEDAQAWMDELTNEASNIPKDIPGEPS